jgi:hypothetical protein
LFLPRVNNLRVFPGYPIRSERITDHWVGGTTQVFTIDSNHWVHRNGLRDQVSSVNGAINSAVDAINKVGGIFGGGVNIPQVNINLDSLANIQIPNTIANGLTELNSTIPTMDELREAIDRV